MSNAQHTNLDQRTREEKEREAAMGEISAVLLNLEHAISRAEKALKSIRKTGAHPNAELALDRELEVLRASRKRLMQQTYYGALDSLQMF
ncbi:hypothetical protein FQ330_01945 [Agrococcus sediminis]|uniref:Uncharacterized protein n=1 Tax=Agrococcus sediminis TaxID=2599924 RepID=A0A5M8QPT5_9MICO|nr:MULTISPECIES: hypothetical protein [Agrococcus]KAA6436202.1 hypothetical protein FQ330_01945 [Agrococcus sediminis]UOW01603.1 hypothetical protein MU522_04115 [Agrococcus sp. SCSIO52902]